MTWKGLMHVILLDTFPDGPQGAYQTQHHGTEVWSHGSFLQPGKWQSLSV